MQCNTDEHYDMYPRYAKTHRPMTLVFARDKIAAAIKEGLIAHRTALYFDNYIIARATEKYLKETTLKMHVTNILVSPDEDLSTGFQLLTDDNKKR